MGGRLHRFEAGGNTYTFPSTLEAYNDNFKDVVTRTTRLPGVDGGFDEYLGDIAAREIGTIRQAFTLQSDTKEGMGALRDAVSAMLTWGKGYLYYRPLDYPSSGESRVYCRVSNISMPRNEGDARTLYWQRVTVIWQASHPLFEADTASSTVINHTGTSTDGTPNQAGNAIALPTITVACGAGQVLTAPWYIRRIVSSVVVDEIEYNYNMPNSSDIVFDCGASSVVYNDTVLTDSEGYDSTMDFIHPDWIRLYPGSNTIRVVSANAGDAATVTVQWRNAYY